MLGDKTEQELIEYILALEDGLWFDAKGSSITCV